jgi:hypothetical protein
VGWQKKKGLGRMSGVTITDFHLNCYRFNRKAQEQQVLSTMVVQI